MPSEDSRDLYATLGISREATQEEIRKAYRKLVRKYHPDANPGDAEAAERFKKINLAYEILQDPQKRAAYDQYGTLGEAPHGGTPFGGFGPFGDIFGDIFDSFFGGAGNPSRGPVRGENIEVPLSISLEDAFSGVTREVSVPRQETCGRCGGSGTEPGSEVRTCPSCRGSGQVEVQQRTPFGTFVSVSQCRDCNGSGKKIDVRCANCGGSGRVRTRHTVEVRIPPGVDSGTRLRVAGEGMEGSQGGPPGDLFISIKVESHPLFERDRDDLHTRLDLKYPQVVLGASVEIPTLDGTDRIEIPPGTPGGKTFRVKGKGMPRLRGSGRGDLFVHVVIEIPKNLSDKERALVEALAHEMDVPVQSTGLMERIRQLLS